jgi:hypothetical protein
MSENTLTLNEKITLWAMLNNRVETFEKDGLGFLVQEHRVILEKLDAQIRG